MARPDKDEDKEFDRRLKAVNEGSEKMSTFEDNFKASMRIGDTESAKHWAAAFGNEMFRGDK